MSIYTKESLRTFFQSTFNLEEWYSFLQNFFIASELKSTPEEINTNNNDKGFYLGNIQTKDSYRIGLFHYKINNGSVANKRVGLRNLVKTFINPNWGEFDAALVVFNSDDNWRFSFICDIKEENTAAKRYTYVFGNKDLLYRTPIERFIQLQKKGISFENIKTAFSVEALSNEFFDKYREQYSDFIQYITGKRFVKVSGKWVEKVLSKPNDDLMKVFDNDEKTIRDYVKKMMGRITFLHFLQRKGWMNGDLNYLQNMFNKSSHKDNYLDTVLEPLFFGILNTIPKEREKVFNIFSWDKSLLAEWKNIPYLNGGLFELTEDDKPKTIFPAEYFQRLFDFFSEYNFTIDENDPNDAEVGVDPEMLGKIFENLLEDNKDKGAFYTPKEIVQYMCQESLIAYLETNTSLAKDKIRNFVLMPEEGVLDIPENKKEKLQKALEEVKICDPAIGSGAFPMGLLNELLHCREVLSGEYYDRAEIKKSIIKNNIYGVDIEKGAVDIARLRFWLSIVVDENTPTPLPNLDYKIMQGNSLIESYQGVDLSNLTYEKKTKMDGYVYSMFDDEKDIYQKEVSNLLSKYYSCSDHKEKYTLQRRISNVIHKLIKSQGYESILSELQEMNLAENNKFFLWHTWFSDVFNREDEKNGFDIVIGNPPYIGEKGHKEIFQPVKADIHLGRFYLGKMDYFYFFFHLSLNMLCDNGISTFITTNYYPTASGARKLRADIKERANIKILVNLGELRLFENAPGQHNMISSFKKELKNCECKIIDVHKKGALNPQLFSLIINGNNEDTSYMEVDQDNLFDGDENYIRLQDNNNHVSPLVSLLKKIQTGNLILGQIAEVNAGIMGGCDSITNHNMKYTDALYIENNDIQKDDGVFVLDSKYSRDLNRIKVIEQYSFFKDFYKNSDINRYNTIETTTKRIIFSSSDTPIIDQTIIKSSLLKYKPILIRIREINNENTEYWHQLRRGTAHPNIFIGAKIVCPQRSKLNTFGYNECNWYASADVYYITNPNKDFEIKYILGLLNSKLYYVWLYNKGKRKGESLELYQKPLSEIPIKLVSKQVQKNVIDLVDSIIKLKNSNPNNDTTMLENQIDQIVYSIYELTDEEINIVEGF